jgi:minimal PKS chain-length factor (CLF/KS beta)
MTNGLLSKASTPEDAYRPFDKRGNGYVPGEGGALMLVERLEHAQKRNAPQIYGEIAGYGATQDAYHPTRPAPGGKQLARAITLALREAGIGPPDVDAIFLDALGAPEWDTTEVQAIRQVFKELADRTPATAPKTMVGRLHSGGAALDVATALLAIRDQVIPPTINVHEPRAGCELNFVVGQPQQKALNHVLLIARGFGGFNSALVLRRFAA